MKKFRNYLIIVTYLIANILISSNFVYATDRADDCDNSEQFKPYDQCRGTTNDSNTFIPLVNNSCDYNDGNNSFSFDPYSSKEYYYENNNVFCLATAASLWIAIRVGDYAASIPCLAPKGDPKSSSKMVKALRITKKLGRAGKATIKTAAKLFFDPKIAFQADFIITFGYLYGYCGYLTGAAIFTGGASGANAAACCTATTIGAAVVQSTFWGVMGTVYEIADLYRGDVRVCGYDWKNWGCVNVNGTQVPCDLDRGDYPQRGVFNRSYKKKVLNCIIHERCDVNLNMDYDENDFSNSEQIAIEPTNQYDLKKGNRIYREYLYDGKEYTYFNTDDGCFDPRTVVKKGYKEVEQRYYLKGRDAGNYACERFDSYTSGGCVNKDGNIVSPESDCVDIYKKAHECCISRSKKSICIEDTADNRHDNTFCRLSEEEEGVFDFDSKCWLGAVGFEAYKSVKSPYSKICVRSFSVCPYNFNVATGSEKEEWYCGGHFDSHGKCAEYDSGDFDRVWTNGELGHPTKAYGKIKNFCQYDAHCTELAIPPYTASFQGGSKFLDPACKNFVGDSKNTANIDSFDSNRNSSDIGIANIEGFKGIDLGKYRGFTAPMAQCIIESMRNMFLNLAGVSTCAEGIEVNGLGLCGNDSDSSIIDKKKYKIVKGEKLGKDGIFITIQNRVRSIITAVMMLSIVLGGLKIFQSGRIDVFDERSHKGVMLYLLKIGLVLYFSLGNAWQTTFYNGILNATEYAHSQVFATALTSLVGENLVEDNIDGSQIDKNDGCYFRSDDKDGILETGEEVYAEGKSYLAIFDTLDCKMAKYLGYGPDTEFSELILFIITALLSSGLGLLIFFVGLLLFFVIVSLAIKILYIFVISFIAINILIFVSPIIIPTILFSKTKNIFESWLKQLLSFCLQPLFLVLFVGFVIAVFDQMAVGSAQFMHNANNYRDVTLICPEGTYDSLVCLFDIGPFDTFDSFSNASAFIGIRIDIPMLEYEFYKVLLKSFDFLIILYVLYTIVGKIPEVAADITGGQTLEGGDVSAKQMAGKTLGTMNGIKNATKDAGLAGYGKIKRGATKTRQGMGELMRKRRGSRDDLGKSTDPSA